MTEIEAMRQELQQKDSTISDLENQILNQTLELKLNEKENLKLQATNDLLSRQLLKIEEIQTECEISQVCETELFTDVPPGLQIIEAPSTLIGDLASC